MNAITRLGRNALQGTAVNFEINGRQVAAFANETLIEVAAREGIDDEVDVRHAQASAEQGGDHRIRNEVDMLSVGVGGAKVCLRTPDHGDARASGCWHGPYSTIRLVDSQAK